MTTLYLIGCSQKKIDIDPSTLVEARTLYNGDLFNKSREYVEGLGGRWGIVSAKYGCLCPDDRVNIYDKFLTEKQARAPRYGALLLSSFDALLSKLQILTYNLDRVVVLAGNNYRLALKKFVWSEYPFLQHSAPLEGLGIGKQKQKLKALIRGQA